MNPAVFREYDIRGVVGKDLDDAFVADLARAIAAYWVERGVKRVGVGMDARLSSPGFKKILTETFAGSGLGVVDLGLVPTPLLYYALFKLDLDGGVEITGSHNPADNNGFKIALGKTTIYGGEIAKLRELVERGAAVSGSGSIEQYDIIPEYLDEVVSRIQMGPRKLKVVIDPGNGVGGLTAMPVFERLGLDVTGICLEPDGRFPHHHPDPTVADGIEMLRAEVVARGADLGIGFDGDADRIGVVDKHGDAIYGDMLTAILAGEILSRRPGEKIVGEVKCSKIFYDEVVRLGGVPIMSKVGHSLMKARLHSEKAALAGEMSGHIFFSDRWFGFDDAIYAAARLLEILSSVDEPQAVFDRLPKLCNTPEIRFDCPDAIKFAAVERFAAFAKETYTGCVDIDGVRFECGQAWGLVRPSNTQPVIVMRFEAPDSDQLAALEAATRNRLDAIIGELN